MKWMMAGAAGAVAITILAGCGGAAKKVALRVNKKTFTEEEFYQRVEGTDVVALTNSVRSGGPGRAGDVAMRAMIAEALILDLAQSKNAAPSESEINAMLALMKKSGGQNANPYKTDEDRRRDAMTELAAINLMAAPLNLKEEDYTKGFEAMKPQLTQPEKFKIRIIDTKTEAKAKEALDGLAKGLTFETMVNKNSDDLASKSKQGDIGFIPAPALPPDLLAAIKKIKPGEYTKQAVSAMVPPYGSDPSRPGPREKRWFIMKLEETQASIVPTLEEVRPVIRQQLVMQKDPGAAQRIAESVRETIQKADIQVNIKKYEPLVASVKQGASQPMQNMGGVAPGAATSVPPPVGGAGAPAGGAGR